MRFFISTDPAGLTVALMCSQAGVCTDTPSVAFVEAVTSFQEPVMIETDDLPADVE